MIEKYRTTGNDCGDASVNNSFLEFLVTIFGSQVMTSLRKEDPVGLLDLEKDFIYCTVCSKLKERIVLRVPCCLIDLKDVISTSIYGNDIRLRGYKLLIYSNVIRILFKPTIDRIINLMDNVFTEYKNAHKVKEIVMVGDFSECSLVQIAVRQTFSNRNITIPTDSGLAVMKGAVTCGNQPYRYKQLTSTEVR